jgi:hypothetical protein
VRRRRPLVGESLERSHGSLPVVGRESVETRRGRVRRAAVEVVDETVGRRPALAAGSTEVIYISVDDLCGGTVHHGV